MNPIAFLSMKLEWCAYSLVIRSILTPISSGIVKRSDKEAMKKVGRVITMTNRVPLMDLIYRINCIILPVLIGASTDNAVLGIATYLGYRFYNSLKYICFWGAYTRKLRIAVGTLEKKERG